MFAKEKTWKGETSSALWWWSTAMWAPTRNPTSLIFPTTASGWRWFHMVWFTDKSNRKSKFLTVGLIWRFMFTLRNLYFAFFSLQCSMLKDLWWIVVVKIVTSSKSWKELKDIDINNFGEYKFDFDLSNMDGFHLLFCLFSIPILILFGSVPTWNAGCSGG